MFLVNKRTLHFIIFLLSVRNFWMCIEHIFNLLYCFWLGVFIFIAKFIYVWFIENKNCIFIFQIIDLNYDKRIGYTLRSPSVRDSGVFNCEANRNNVSESRPFSVHVQRNCELVLLLSWCVVIDCKELKIFRLYLALVSF